MIILKKNFKIPEIVKTDNFVVRKLQLKDVYQDYLAVMQNIDLIKETRGGSWPTERLTLEEDLVDLGWHEGEFNRKSSFAYTIFNTENTKCMGCAYLYPPGYRNNKSKNADVDFSFWVVKESYDDGLYIEIYEFFMKWLRETWGFSKVVCTNNLIPKVK